MGDKNKCLTLKAMRAILCKAKNVYREGAPWKTVLLCVQCCLIFTANC